MREGRLPGRLLRLGIAIVVLVRALGASNQINNALRNRVGGGGGLGGGLGGDAGTYSIICNEYCGINHHTMVSRLYVVKP